jgi:hypothetical protein
MPPPRRKYAYLDHETKTFNCKCGSVSKMGHAGESRTGLHAYGYLYTTSYDN